MKSFFKIEGLRGSLFIPFIPFNWAFVNDLFKILPNFIPSVNQLVPQIINGMVSPPGDWLIFSPDNKSKLIFQQQKVDFIMEVGDDYSSEVIEDFAKKCQDIFEIIMNYSQQHSSRIAIAPTYKWGGDKKVFEDFTKKMFNKNSFKSSSIANCDFSQVYRVNENINNLDIKLNYLSKFYVTNSIAVINGINSVQDTYMMDFDINTFVDPQYSFDKVTVSDFFSKAVKFCTSFMDFYFSENT